MHLRFLPLCFVFAVMLSSTGSVMAAWPEKPIRLIVPSAPGGAPDVLMRAMSAQLSQQLGVSIVIDNKPGGSYVIGTMDLVRSPADGYTLAYGNVVSLATNRSLLANVPYDVDKDLTLISNALRVVNMLTVNNNVPVNTVPEFIAYAKKNPGKVAFASDGNGTTSHLGMELFKSMTGTSMLHVPYKAATAAVTDLISGSVQAMIANTPVLGPHAQAGRIRALGVSSLERLSTYPDLPPIEQTVPGFEVIAWGGVIGPANLPPEIITRLNTEIRTALNSPAVQARFRALGAETSPSTPQEFHDLSRRETEKWAKVIKLSGAKID